MTTPNDHAPSRRKFLKQTGMGVAAGLGAGATANAALLTTPSGQRVTSGPLGQKTKRVVVVAFAGGVRTQDVLGQPKNAPQLERIAAAGVTFPKVRAANVGHYGAALSIFTGFEERMGIRENQRGVNPTVFEALQKDGPLAPGDVWLSTASGAQGRLFAHSDHPDYGGEFAAQVLDGDGIFNVEFKRVLQSFGRPTVDTDETRATIAALQGTLQELEQEGAPTDAENTRRVERFILDELSGNTTKVTGPGAADAKALRVATNILRTFKPKLLGVTLQNADIAHGSYNGYLDVIRRNDAEVGALWDAIQADDELREDTALFVLPEFGRDANLNERNGLDHGDGSDAMKTVFLIAAGPDFAQGVVQDKEIRTIDIAPTILSLLQKRPSLRTAGRKIAGLSS